jgi:hypothetical protein
MGVVPTHLMLVSFSAVRNAENLLLADGAFSLSLIDVRVVGGKVLERSQISVSFRILG